MTGPERPSYRLDASKRIKRENDFRRVYQFRARVFSSLLAVCCRPTAPDQPSRLGISVSKKIVNLFPGTAEEAQADGAVLLEPTTDEVTYSDGMTEEVYGFDIPVPAIGEEFDCALVGEKGKWYDHKVKVTDPVKAE